MGLSVKVAFLFPGQGSQQVGMGKAVYEVSPAAKEVYREAEAALGWPIAEISFNGPEEKLNRTEYTQPALLTASTALWRALPRSLREQAGVVAGHSLGEYSALVAAGSLSFAEAVRLVHRRGIFMQEAVPEGKGKMAAILGLNREKVVELCLEAARASQGGAVVPANYNSPDQIVVAGESASVERAMALAKERGAKRVIPLEVSVPSHSPLMVPACDRLSAELEKIRFRDPAVPLINNLEARAVTTGDYAKKGLVGQLSSPLLWEESVRAIWEMGMRRFVEVGPGRVLSGLVKRICREAEVFNIEDPAGIVKAAAALGG
jgi:[acyl-carrier-protein] S-malonyltransferase